MEHSSPSHLVRLLNQHLAYQIPPEPAQTLKTFFPYLYPKNSGGLQAELLSALLFQLDRHDVAKAHFAIEVCNQFGYSATSRDSHPLSLRTQTKTEIAPVFDWFDSVFKKTQPERPYASFTYSDAWSRGSRYWWENLLDGIDANVLFRTHDFVFEFFGDRFGRAVCEISQEESRSTLSIGMRKRLTSAFEQLSNRILHHHPFWEAMVPQLPPHPYFLAIALAKGPPVGEPRLQSETLAWFDQAFSTTSDHAVLLAETVRQNSQLFSEWTPFFAQHPLLLSIGQTLLSVKSAATHKVIDQQHFERCITSLEQAVLRGQYSPSLELSPEPQAL